MSIETLLTLGVAFALLVIASVLRLVILTVLRVGSRLTGRDTSWLSPSRRELGRGADRKPRRRREVATSLRPRVSAAGGKARAGLSAAGTALLAAAATIWTALVRSAAAAERWAERTNRRLAPAVTEVRAGARRSTADIGKYAVAGIATLQHLALLVARRMRPPFQSGGASPDRNASPSVIDLGDDQAVDGSTASERHSVSV